MTIEEFYKIYIPALEIALANDHVNHGYAVLTPDFYMEEADVTPTDQYIDTYLMDDEFIVLIEHYFHAISHYYDWFDGEAVYVMKARIIEMMERIKSRGYL